MINCRSCEIALPDGTRLCPMCHRNLMVPTQLLIFSGVLAFVLLVCGFLWSTGRLKNRVDRRELSPKEVLSETEKLVARNPGVGGPGTFSHIDQTTVEHWDGRRWRVSGYVDTRPKPGVKLRTLYFAVVHHNGTAWSLEDLQLQSMELGAPPSRGN